MGCGCTYCNNSKGVEFITNFLTEKNISFKKEKTFPNCKHIKSLRFDFYLFNYNVCIEFDGMQHFKPIKRFGGEKAFNSLQQRDSIKTTYCLENNIPLLRIRYDDDIEEKLNNFLIKNKILVI